MAEHDVELVANEGTFVGLAKQNLLFHQCVGELVDNAIAARLPGNKFRVDINLSPDGEDAAWVSVADQSAGMDLPKLMHALQWGILLKVMTG